MNENITLSPFPSYLFRRHWPSKPTLVPSVMYMCKIGRCKCVVIILMDNEETLQKNLVRAICSSVAPRSKAVVILISLIYEATINE